MSKEAIIKKITDDANAKADKLTEESKAKAEAILADARKECDEQLVAAREELERALGETLARSETVAELDSKRLLLDARLKILDRVFARALEKLVALDDKKMKSLLLSMLSAAENGDEVVLNERGKKLLGEDVKEYAKKRKLSLTLSDEAGDFAGGVVLRQGGIEKNLTFESELSLLREREESNLAKQIFG